MDASRIVLGCGNFGGIGSAPALFGKGESREEAFALMDAAWERGIRHFDTADAYGGGRSEAWIGEWMREGGRRPRITTKVFHSVVGDPDDRGLAPERIRRQLHGSLERLGVDAVDLYLTHQPDPVVPIEETVAELARLRDEGLIRAFGLSNGVTPDDLERAVAAGPVACVQDELSLLARGRERLLDACAGHGIAFQAFSPLAGGWLTGKYTRHDGAPPGSRMALRPEPYAAYRDERVFSALDRFRAAAAERGVDMATLGFAWLLADPRIAALVTGARSAQHLEPAFSALSLDLDPEERDGVAALFSDVYEPPVASAT